MRLYRNIVVDAALQTLGVKNRDSLYDWQKEVMQAILREADIFLSVPTAGGKSLLYQLLAILEASRALTLVISPLRALQQDQVSWLTKCGVKAAWLNSDLSNHERRKILDNLTGYCLLYLAPEQLFAKDLQKALARCRIGLVAVDEAHVLPQAASSFRQAYGKIGSFICGLPCRPEIIACTATATLEERKTIIESLGMDNPEVFTYPMRRNNLHLSIKEITVSKKCKSKEGELERLLFQDAEAILQEWKKDGSKGSVIIYCPTVRRVKALKRWLKGRSWDVTAYTGKMSQQDRLKAQKQFTDGFSKIIVATNAFGLGINKQDVRLVIHAGLPLTLGGYVQEIGRAGRDGEKAKCVLFYSESEFQRNEHILKRPRNEEAVWRSLKGLNALKKILKSDKCIWSGIEKHYGREQSAPCGHCCHCKAKAARRK